jgi:hypothetical protein
LILLTISSTSLKKDHLSVDFFGITKVIFVIWFKLKLYYGIFI